MKGLSRVYSLILMLLLFSGAVKSQTHFIARLTGDQEIPAVNSTAKGTAALTLTDQGLSYIVTIDSIDQFTEAHFLIGATGDTGRSVKAITASFRGNTASGIWTSADAEPLTNDIITSLVSGKVYINILTAANPKGELRGQIVPASGTSFRASLSGLEVVPSINTGATGTASFLLTDAALFYSVTAAGMTGITGASLGLGAIGQNGTELIPITFEGNKASGVLTRNGTPSLTERVIRAMLLDSLYIAVNTTANPGGEIRGQVIQSGGHFFTANLTGSQEIPANNTFAKGSGYFTLTKEGLVFAVTVNIGETILAVNLLNAPAGMTGTSTIKDLTPLLVNGKTISGVWRFNDAEQPLTKELISELMKGNIYINYYTAKYPNGEIRGQLTPSAGVSFKSHLSSAQVNPPLPDSAKAKAEGTGNFVLSSDGLSFNITVSTPDTLKTAHFYVGKAGQPVVYLTSYVRSIREFRGTNATGVWKFVDTVDSPLTPKILESLLKDEVFVNIRTRKDTLGGIRGQVLLNGGTSFRALLTGSQEVPKPKTNATGTGDFILTNQGLTYRITVDSVVVASAHFHMAPIGQSGGVVKDITTDFANNTAKGTWMTTGNQALTGDLIKALLTGNIYVNVHSPNNPNGEIRGQLLLNEGWGFTASLNGKQIVPPNNSTAGGTASFTYTPAGLTYDATLAGLAPTSLTINRGPVGQSGDMVRDLFAELNGSRTVSGAWIYNDADTLNNDVINSLLSEGLYITAGSSAFAQGEIRGQIVQTVSGAVLSVKNRENKVPKAFELEQNYPNPFNPSTTIRFAVPAYGPVELSIYNILGEKVMTLINSNMAAGSYEVNFNASNLASGIYLYRLQSGQNLGVKKMMLVK